MLRQTPTSKRCAVGQIFTLRAVRQDFTGPVCAYKSFFLCRFRKWQIDRTTTNPLFPSHTHCFPAVRPWHLLLSSWAMSCYDHKRVTTRWYYCLATVFLWPLCLLACIHLHTNTPDSVGMSVGDTYGDRYNFCDFALLKKPNKYQQH